MGEHHRRVWGVTRVLIGCRVLVHGGSPEDGRLPANCPTATTTALKRMTIPLNREEWDKVVAKHTDQTTTKVHCGLHTMVWISAGHRLQVTTFQWDTYCNLLSHTG